MSRYTKEEIKKRYMDFLTRLGYKIIYDLDKNMEDTVHDLKLFLTMKYPDQKVFDPQVALRYIPYVIEKVSNLSFSEF